MAGDGMTNCARSLECEEGITHALHVLSRWRAWSVSQCGVVSGFWSPEQPSKYREYPWVWVVIHLLLVVKGSWVSCPCPLPTTYASYIWAPYVILESLDKGWR